MRSQNHFVEDGCRRAALAIESQIRAEVLAEYAERLERESVWGRFLLKWQIRRDIERRIAKCAPPHALY